MKTEDEIKLKLKELILSRNIALMYKACEVASSYEADIKCLNGFWKLTR